MTHEIATPAETNVSDEQLAERAAAGDAAAFETFYRRHAPPLYDFVIRTVRDPDVAADVVQEAFVKAWQALPGLRKKAGVRSWLYSIARNRAIDQLRRAKHTAPLGRDDDDEPGGAFAIVDPGRASDPQAVAGDRELVALVWEAAAALSPSDYSILDLHLRQGFESAELAEALGTSLGSVYTRLTRLRQALAESVVALLLARRGGDRCPELRVLLEGLPGGPLSQDGRRQIARHAGACPRCDDTRRQVVSPLVLFGCLAPVPLAQETEARVWERIRGGMAPRTRPARRAHRGAIAAGLAAVVLAGLIAWILAGTGGETALRAPADPNDVRSTTHTPGVASTLREVTLVWTPPASAEAYSYSWDREPVSLPDAEAEIPGTATGVTSPSLAPGRWYFHMRTRDPDGRWTSTVHAGPFDIAEPGGIAAEGTPLPTQTPSPAATVEPTATPVPPVPPVAAPAAVTPATSGVQPNPPATPTATATATATATPTRTPTPVPPAATPTPRPPTPTPTPVPPPPDIVPDIGGDGGGGGGHP